MQVSEEEVEGAFLEEAFNREASSNPGEDLLHATSSPALSLSSNQEEDALKVEDSLREEDSQDSQDLFVSIATFRSRPGALQTWTIIMQSVPVTRCPRCRTEPGLGTWRLERSRTSTASLLKTFPSLVCRVVSSRID